LYSGKIEIAMKAAIRCCEFIDILNSVQVYSLIALTSYMSKYFEVCSMSLTKLLTLDNIDKTSILLIQKLAFAIFTQQKPVNKKDLDTCYKQCLESGKGYHACTITGKSIVQKRALQCRYCRFYMLEEEARGRSSCALCHDSCRDAEVVTILA
jgi:WD repeat-containing protein 35